ncbi:MAG: TVP38/TMEM64 family protein [Rhodospirillales bacterium]|nr:TVP38/TMEM64 family protein [Rhodospirillales bacterium]
MSRLVMEKIEAIMVQNTPREIENKPTSLWRFAPLLAIAGAIGLFFALGYDQYLTFEALKENRQQLLDWKTNNHLLTILVFIGVYAIATSLSIPGAIWLTISSGFLFGSIEGTLYAVSGATIGATINFLVVRYSFHDFFREKAGASLKKMEDGFNENAFSYLMVLRLVPLFPFWMVNLVSGVLGVNMRTYMIATFFGIIPGAFVYASVGNGLGAIFDTGQTPDLGIIFSPEILTPIIGLAILAVIPIAYKKYKEKNQ